MDIKNINGTSWTEVNNLATSRKALTGVGNSSSLAIAAGATAPGQPAVNTEEWTIPQAIKTIDLS